MLHTLLPTPQGLIQVIHLGSNAASWCLHARSILPVLRRIRCSIVFLELPFFFMEVFPSILYIIWFIWFHSLVLHQDTSMVLSSWDTLDNQVINTHGTTAVLKNTGSLECQWFAIFAVRLINQSRIKFVCVCLVASVVSGSVTLWTVAQQAPLCMGCSRQEHWSELPFPSPGDLPDPGIEPTSLMFSALAGGFFTTSAI